MGGGGGGELNSFILVGEGNTEQKVADSPVIITVFVRSDTVLVVNFVVTVPVIYRIDLYYNLFNQLLPALHWLTSLNLAMLFSTLSGYHRKTRT